MGKSIVGWISNAHPPTMPDARCLSSLRFASTEFFRFIVTTTMEWSMNASHGVLIGLTCLTRKTTGAPGQLLYNLMS